MSAQKKILVIKLGALGDFIQALGPMKAIREHHKSDHITLLTTAPFKELASKSGYFDNIWVDQRPKFYNFLKLRAFRKMLVHSDFHRVYDLQNNDRTHAYFRLFGAKKPEWSGSVASASHANTSKERTAGKSIDGHIQTLAIAGINNVEIDDLSWIKADIERFKLKTPYILIVPGSAPSRPEKRWPASHYAALAGDFCQRGYNPVVLGTSEESEIADVIAAQNNKIINLAGKTNLFDIAALARNSALSIGNDTGPMHIIAASGSPCLVLFSKHSKPHRHAPPGDNVHTLKAHSLQTLAPAAVLEFIEEQINL
jgi:ADP-heptose:LPS heptosyltransferase